MAIDSMFNSASSVMTVVSLITFLGILWWTFGIKRSVDFDTAAGLPFADEPAPPQDKIDPQAVAASPSEQPHV
ncbi:MAG: CcoQ/FixQ family Cbb3-type cytochrome c oxidase assembly chaperone [Herminiimonas sp.]|nr:CcoQ/FixQ family Cbb3-type cytochrome c oxidase assembly chaperone [Herminiimonas sp.]